MKFEKPKSFMGVPIEGAMDRFLNEEAERAKRNSAAPQSKPSPSVNTSVLNKGDYIILPGAKHGSYEYGDLLVAKRRLVYGPEVEQVAKTLGLTNLADASGNKSFGNTSLTSNGHAYDYIGNINWDQALKLNLALGGKTLNPRQHADLRKLLQDGIDNNLKVHDGQNNEVSSQELFAIYNDLLENKNPWRSEWLDAKFTKDGEDWKITYNHILDASGNLIGKTEGLEECIMNENCATDLIFNHQGLATTKSTNQNYEQGKNVYFWHPRENRVAGFDADSGRAGLDCSGGPSAANGRLGVRVAREK